MEIATIIQKIEREISTPQQTKTTANHYDYAKVLDFLEKKGKQLYGPHFILYKEDMRIILLLAAYFLKDYTKCQQYNIDPNKGIMLSGPIGCGKTSLINLMKYLATDGRKFRIKSCRDVSFEFIKDGYDVIHRYTKGEIYRTEYHTYCFDDLGTENNLKYFGNECNVLGEILLSRYDLYITKGLITHLTTNLSATELEDNYGNRLRSRLRQMVNLISFDLDVKDKRN